MLCFPEKYRFSRSGAATVMAIRIKARGGESAEQMLRRFKKLCEKEGLTKDVKKRQYFEKPSAVAGCAAVTCFSKAHAILRPLES